MPTSSDWQQSTPILHVFDDRAELIEALCHYVAAIANQAIEERNLFRVVIAGGGTLVPLYKDLSRISTRWESWRVYWSDERCVAPDHSERNSRQAIAIWLSQVPIPENQIFQIPAELGPHLAVERYSNLLASVDRFDVCLLSLGPDGHVASIFQENILESRKTQESSVIAVMESPKPPSPRVSLTISRLASSNLVIIVAVGGERHEALENLLAKVEKPSAVLASVSNTEVWCDRAAFGEKNACE